MLIGLTPCSFLTNWGLFSIRRVKYYFRLSWVRRASNSRVLKYNSALIKFNLSNLPQILKSRSQQISYNMYKKYQLLTAENNKNMSHKSGDTAWNKISFILMFHLRVFHPSPRNIFPECTAVRLSGFTYLSPISEECNLVCTLWKLTLVSGFQEGNGTFLSISKSNKGKKGNRPVRWQKAMFSQQGKRKVTKNSRKNEKTIQRWSNLKCGMNLNILLS